MKIRRFFDEKKITHRYNTESTKYNQITNLNSLSICRPFKKITKHIEKRIFHLNQVTLKIRKSDPYERI